MSVRAITEVWSKSAASGSGLLVLLALADHADDGGVCFPYITSLASKARCDEKTVRRVLRELHDDREIDVWEWYDKRGGRKRNCYRIVLGSFAALRGVEPEEIRSRATVLRVNIPTAARRRIFERDGWRCVKCESKIDLVIDHVVPVAEGGGNEDENLQTLCSICNAEKAAKVPEEVESRPGEMSGRLAERNGPDVRSEGNEMSGPARAPSLLVLNRQGNQQEPPLPPAVERPANRPVSVARKPVTDSEYETASEVLAVFNAAAGTVYSSADWIAKIISRLREHPSLTVEAHEVVIRRAFAGVRWWTGPPSPSIVYGNAAHFERCVHAVRTAPEERGMTAEEMEAQGG